MTIIWLGVNSRLGPTYIYIQSTIALRDDKAHFPASPNLYVFIHTNLPSQCACAACLFISGDYQSQLPTLGGVLWAGRNSQWNRYLHRALVCSSFAAWCRGSQSFAGNTRRLPKMLVYFRPVATGHISSRPSVVMSFQVHRPALKCILFSKDFMQVSFISLATAA